MAGTWVLVAFAVGGVANRGSTARGAGTSLLSLVVATLAYYVGTAIAWDLVSVDRLIPGALVWGTVGLVAGPLSGGAGAVWRQGRFRGQSHWWYPAVAVGVLAAPLIVEAMSLLVQFRGTDSSLGAAAELVIGFALPPLLMRSVRGSIAAYATATVLAVIGLPVLLVVLPAIYMLAGSGHL